MYTLPGLHGYVDYKTEVHQSNIDDIIGICKELWHRGCDGELAHLNRVVDDRYGHLLVPTSMTKAMDHVPGQHYSVLVVKMHIGLTALGRTQPS